MSDTRLQGVHQAVGLHWRRGALPDASTGPTRGKVGLALDQGLCCLLQGVELSGIDVYGRLPSVVVNITPPPVADRLKTVTNFAGTMEGIDVPFVKVSVSPVVNVINFKWETMSTLKATPPVTISTSPTAIVKNVKWQFSPILAPLVKTTILR